MHRFKKHWQKFLSTRLRYGQSEFWELCSVRQMRQLTVILPLREEVMIVFNNGESILAVGTVCEFKEKCSPSEIVLGDCS